MPPRVPLLVACLLAYSVLPLAAQEAPRIQPTKTAYRAFLGPIPKTGADALGSIYGPTFRVGDPPRVPAGTKGALRDVADDQFWSPFQ